jgi:replication initiation protein RepC
MMQRESALAAQRASFIDIPTGFGRLTPVRCKRLAPLKTLPASPTSPARPDPGCFQGRAPRLGLTPAPRLVHTIDWLFRFTQPQDWETEARPIVWPSAAMQRDALGLSETQVKVLNRAFIEAGLITMKDGPNGKRYSKRDSEGCIIEAYGFDLSPLAARMRGSSVYSPRRRRSGPR